jgi:hypothetical protein
VHETLSYAALLRLPRELSRAQKLERVEQVIDALGVRKSKNTIIGESPSNPVTHHIGDTIHQLTHHTSANVAVKWQLHGSHT